ncbi:mitochondrial import receptor subunit TOM40 homolog 1-like [Cephus cinctus]|uniref:Mitochondrial import receptor subunit TOM40 homolog 1-like n=1 Tax=Cephus cinctus TaxID=211228 RepID=A0AAJ7FH62_CEPCN|nr:mitochondrial import receptor subunit TOM40 homolog 1-like [Cephus cinctus]
MKDESRSHGSEEDPSRKCCRSSGIDDVSNRSNSSAEDADVPRATCIPCPKDQRKPGNPGSFEEIHKKVKDLYPRHFEGIRLVVNKILSKHFQVKHTLTMSSVTPAGYKFGATYAGTKRVGMHESYPVAIGEIAPNGSMTGSFVHTLGCRLRLKYSAQIDSHQKYKACSSTAEYRSDDFTISLTLANPSFIKRQGTVVLHFLQSITSRIALGAEVACLRGSLIPGGQETIMSGAFRYSTGRTTLSGTLGEAGLHLCYHQKASEQLQLGVELETNMRTHESVATIVYRVDVDYADLVFRGYVNSETTVAAVLEKKLYPIPESSLVLSAMLNHAKQQFRVGIGINIG